jgi:carboxylesterase type B
MKTNLMLWFLIIQAISLVSSHKINFKKLVVLTESGPVQGLKKTSILGRDYFSFQSIPYMKAPVGKLRFRDPQPPAKWFTPLDATKEPPSYPCFDSFCQKFVGQEDAAMINVFTPYLNPIRKLPVLVWIHGGSFHVSLKLLKKNLTLKNQIPGIFKQN